MKKVIITVAIVFGLGQMIYASVSPTLEAYSSGPTIIVAPR